MTSVDPISPPGRGEISSAIVPRISLVITKSPKSNALEKNKDKENLVNFNPDELTKLNSLVSKNKAYNVFKKNQNLMNLFTACQEFEAEKETLLTLPKEDEKDLNHSRLSLSEGVLTPSKNTPRSNKVGDDFVQLPKVKPPYLPEKDPSAPAYTLVLDLDETLIHYVDGNHHSGEDADVSIDADQ